MSEISTSDQKVQMGVNLTEKKLSNPSKEDLKLPSKPAKEQRPDIIEPLSKSKVWYNISNSGVSFDVLLNKSYNEYRDIEINYPILKISSSSFGIQLGEMALPTNPKDLKKLGEWLINQSELAEIHSENIKEGFYIFQMTTYDKATGREVSDNGEIIPYEEPIPQRASINQASPHDEFLSKE